MNDQPDSQSNKRTPKPPLLHLSGLLVKAPNKAIEARERVQFMISMAGIECPRDLFFRAEGKKALDMGSDSSRSFHLSRLLLRLKTRAGRACQTYETAHVYDLATGVDATGIADLVVYSGEARSLIARLHGVRPDGWANACEAIHSPHRGEANLLAYALDAPRWSVFYVRETDGVTVEYTGETDKAEAKEALARFAQILEARRVGEPPQCTLSKRIGADMAPCCRDEWRKFYEPALVHPAWGEA